MPRYRVTRRFGSHLGNHEVGEPLNLPEGPLPRGFQGFVEAWPEPSVQTKDITPASGRADDAPPQEAGTVPPAADSEASSPSASDAPSSPEEPPTPAPRAEAGHYSDKAIRARRRP